MKFSSLGPLLKRSRGKNHCVICVFQGMSSVFFNKGENCIAAGRLFVEDSIHDQFVKKVVCVSLSHSVDVF